MAAYNTMQRTSILSFLETNIGQAFTVKEIVEGIRSDSAAGCSPSESTVYRIMTDLEKTALSDARSIRIASINTDYLM